MRVKLLTYNTFGVPFFAQDIAKRYKKIAEIIASENIDIVCFQEIFSHYNHRLFEAFMKDYPYRIARKNMLGIYGGLAVYSKLPISYVSFQTYSYSKEMNIPFYTKLAQSGFLVCKLQEFPLYLITTHLTTDTVHNLTPKNKFYNLIRNQIRQVATEFSDLGKEGNSVLLAGDFNTSKGSLLYKEFLTETKSEDVFKTYETPTYFPDRFRYRYPTFPAESPDRIDYMFYNNGKAKIRPVKTGHMFEEQVRLQSGKMSYLSDHIGIVATLEIS